jgi:outer membrane protein assembly factor BamB
MPTVASDGEHLYVANGGNATNASRVVRVDLRTGEEKEVCKARPSVWALSPNGSQIACAGFGDSIQILPTQGGPALDLVKADQFGPMTWTADGKHLIYTTTTASDSGPGGSGGYWIVPATGGTARKIDIGLGTIGLMSVHPDNHHIAISSAGSSTELWVLENILSPSK